MKSRKIACLAVAATLLSPMGAAYGQAALVRHHEMADSVLVIKSKRKLYLLKDGEVLREFDIALGLMPNGPKQREGDFRTPEGK